MQDSVLVTGGGGFIGSWVLCGERLPNIMDYVCISLDQSGFIHA